MPAGSAISRRRFLAVGAQVGLGIAALAGANGLAVAQQVPVLGANERVRLAVCGVRKRGFDHVRLFSQIPNVQIVALCDVDENVLRQRLADMDKLGLPKPQTYTDVRKLLEDKSIDAVCIATPHHWHKLIAIWACQAGKDDQETPNTLNCAFQYDPPGGKRKMIELEVRHGITNREADIGTD